MRKLTVALIAGAPLLPTVSGAAERTVRRTNLPVEWYGHASLWSFGDNRGERHAAGCLKWGTFNRSWYDVCGKQHPATVVRA